MYRLVAIAAVLISLELFGLDFSLPATDGKTYSLAGSAVVVFVGVGCPYSNSYNQRYNELAADLRKRPKPVPVFFVNSNDDESLAAAKKHAAEKGFTFPVLKDEGHRVADALGAQKTPEAYLLRADGTVLYRGRIDDDTEGKEIHRRDLLAAVDEYLAGKPVTTKTTRAFGCAIVRR